MGRTYQSEILGAFEINTIALNNSIRLQNWRSLHSCLKNYSALCEEVTGKQKKIKTKEYLEILYRLPEEYLAWREQKYSAKKKKV